METMKMMIEGTSKFGFDETVEKITGTIKNGGWNVVTSHDLQGVMKKHGKTVRPMTVIEICNVELAFRMIGTDVYRNIGPMLPCRIAVYQKENGNTYISRMNAPAFAKMLGGDAEKTMVRAFDETEALIKGFIA